MNEESEELAVNRWFMGIVALLGAYLLSPTPDQLTLSLRGAISVVASFLMASIVERKNLPQQFPPPVAGVVVGACGALMTDGGFWVFSLLFG